MRRAVCVAGAMLGLLGLTPASGAATTFGSSLTRAPAGARCETPQWACTAVSAMRIPVSGVVTKVRMRAAKTGPGPGEATPRLANVFAAGGDGAAGRLVGDPGPTVRVAGTGGIEEFAVRLPVWAGAHLALQTSNVEAVAARSGSPSTYIFSPALFSRAGMQASSGTAGELLVQATVEPDADHDGFGDQTQDHVGPRLAALRIGRRTAAFRLSGAARVGVRLQKRTRHGRLHTIRRRRVDGRRGTNTLRFAKRLAPGRYRLVLVARDSAGNGSKVLAMGFRIRPRS